MTETDNVQTRVVVKPIGSALPLGFFAFGMGMLITGAMQLSWFPQSEASTAYVVLLSFVVPLQLAAAVFAFISRDTVAGTTLGVFSGSWIVFSVAGLTSTTPTAAVVGVFALGLAVIALLIASVAIAGQLLVTSILVLASIRSFLLGIFQFTNSVAAETATGIFSVLISAIAGYGAIALLLEEAHGHSILPTGRRGKALSAVVEGGRAAPEEVHTEPGVRPKL